MLRSWSHSKAEGREKWKRGTKGSVEGVKLGLDVIRSEQERRDAERRKDPESVGVEVGELPREAQEWLRQVHEGQDRVHDVLQSIYNKRWFKELLDHGYLSATGHGRFGFGDMWEGEVQVEITRAGWRAMDAAFGEGTQT